MFCCQPREKAYSLPSVILLHAVDDLHTKKLPTDLAQLTGSHYDHASPSMRYLPGETTPAQSQHSNIEERLTQLLRTCATKQDLGIGTVLTLLGPWHHHLQAARHALDPKKLASVTSALLYKPLLKAITPTTKEPALVMLRYMLLFRGQPTKGPASLEHVARKDVSKIMDYWAAKLPNGEGAAVKNYLKHIQDHIFFPALGLNESPSVWLEPRQQYDIILQSSDLAATQLRDHLRQRLNTRSPSVLSTGPHYKSDSNACAMCRLYDSLGLPKSKLDEFVNVRMGGTNLRLSNTPLGGTEMSWFDGMVSMIGENVASTLGTFSDGAFNVLGLTPAEAAEIKQPYHLKVYECHEKDPAIVVDYDCSADVGSRDYIGIEKAEDEGTLVAWDWTDGSHKGTLRIPMPYDLPAGAYVARYFNHSGPVGQRAFPVYPEQTGVCGFMDKLKIGGGQLSGDLEDKLDEIIWSCTSIVSGLDRSCVTDQVREKMGVGETCAGCFSKVAQCGRDHCLMKCAIFGPHSKTCRNCVKPACFDDMKKCIGIPANMA